MNPAEELADLLDSWNMPGQDDMTIYARREGSSHDIVMWRRHQHAMILLAQVGVALDNLERMGKNTAGWRIHEAELHRAIVLPDHIWGQPAGAPMIDASAIGSLRALGTLIDLVATPAPSTQAKIDLLAEVLAEGVALVADESIPLQPAERAYILTLLQELRDVVEQKMVLGDVDLQERVDRLNGALLRVAADFADAGDPATAEKFQAIIGKILNGTRGTLHDVAVITASVAAVIAIGTGHS